MRFQHLKYIPVLFVIGLFVYACANRASGPGGGPKDSTPPRVLKSTPPNRALHFKKKLIQLDFNEMVDIDKPAENILMSPPQQTPPDVRSLGKSIVIHFNEELKDSTSYSINFGNGIVDLNEKNPLKDYLFSFSTGNQIDTLKLSGTVINAEDLNPMGGIIVGIYSETDDSVFFKKPFLRIGRTDERGHFSIDNVKQGRYKVFALGDDNRDYFHQSGEGLAMHDSIVTPTFRMEQMRDTVWKDSTHIDSIKTYTGTRFLPDNLTLRYFKENKKRQYFVKAERKEPFKFSLFFNAPASELPKMKPLNFSWEGKYLLQKSVHNDSLTYWITDSLVWKMDTLQFNMTYLKSDSAFNLKPTTDTLHVVMKKKQTNPRKKSAKPVKVKKVPLSFTTNIVPVFEVFNPIILHAEAPLSNIDISTINLLQRVDTTFQQIPFTWRQVDSTKMHFAIEYKWIPEKSYRLDIDSAAFKSIYDRASNKLKSDFTIRSLDAYSSIKLYLAEFTPTAMIQLLNSNDAVVVTKPAVEKGTDFQYLHPGDYYLRMFIDENANGRWDTGDVLAKRQPEQVYYYPKKLTLKANWDFEETWDYKLKCVKPE